MHGRERAVRPDHRLGLEAEEELHEAVPVGLEARRLAQLVAEAVELRRREPEQRSPARVQRAEVVHRPADRRHGAVEVVDPEPPLGQLPLAPQQQEPQLHHLGDDEEGRLGGMVGDRPHQPLQRADADVLLVRGQRGELDHGLRRGISRLPESSRASRRSGSSRTRRTDGRLAERSAGAPAAGATRIGRRAAAARRPGPGRRPAPRTGAGTAKAVSAPHASTAGPGQRRAAVTPRVSPVTTQVSASVSADARHPRLHQRHAGHQHRRDGQARDEDDGDETDQRVDGEAAAGRRRRRRPRSRRYRAASVPGSRTTP